MIITIYIYNCISCQKKKLNKQKIMATHDRYTHSKEKNKQINIYCIHLNKNIEQKIKSIPIIFLYT